MPVEEYEEWFREVFPNIQRPQTAPPATNRKGNNINNNNQTDKPASALKSKSTPAMSKF